METIKAFWHPVADALGWILTGIAFVHFNFETIKSLVLIAGPVLFWGVKVFDAISDYITKRKEKNKIK